LVQNYARAVAISWGSNYVDLKQRQTKNICVKLMKLSQEYSKTYTALSEKIAWL
jgi:hypothetical protein